MIQKMLKLGYIKLRRVRRALKLRRVRGFVKLLK